MGRLGKAGFHSTLWALKESTETQDGREEVQLVPTEELAEALWALGRLQQLIWSEMATRRTVKVPDSLVHGEGGLLRVGG